MKKIFSILTLALLIAAVPANAQPGKDFFNLGVKAGLNFSNMSDMDDAFESGFLKTYTGFNAGLVFNFNLPLGFEINPELQYVQSGISTPAGDGNIFGLMDYTIKPSTFYSGSLRVPINIQWGFRFLNIIKPYVVVSPYVGAVLFGSGSILGVDLDKETVNQFLNRFQYGIGLGAGIYVWRFQVSFKWNWDLNPVFDNDFEFRGGMIEMEDDSRFNGGELSLAFFF